MSSASTELHEPPPPVHDPPPPSSVLWERVRAVQLSTWVTLFVLAFCVAFTFSHLQPHLILRSTTPAGGDMGAHVWAPAYLRDELLPSLRLTGWTPDWYAGFPALQFYMVPPMLAIVLLDVVLPYGVAFKLVAISGVVTLPVAVWLFGRLAGLRHPAPELLAVGSVGFLFDRTYSILGGNIPSTLAGEFSFSISLSLAVVYLGLVANGLQTGRYRALAAVLVALVALTHVIPLFFAIAGTFLLLALYPSKAGLRWILASAPVGALLAMWWLLPFWSQRAFMNDMGWEKRFPPDAASTGEQLGFWLTRLFPEDVRLVAFVALIGVVLALTRRVVPALFLVGMLLVAGVGFVVAPQGRLWNERLLPFVHLCTYLLAAFGVAELLRFATERRPRIPAASSIALGLVTAAFAFRLVVGRQVDAGAETFWPRFLTGAADGLMVVLLLAGLAFALRWVLEPVDRSGRLRVRSAGAAALAVVGLGIVAFPLHALPLGGYGNDGAYRWLVWSTTDSSYIPSWARWNFEGYEGKAAWPEYEDVVLTMGNIGERNGCGRAMWEYDRGLDRYGTPMALMLLPMWTDRCIGSMEGLYFESSVTTPFHFLNQSALSESPSRAQRNMPYTDFDIDLGVRQLQMMGVRYYMAESDLAQRSARAHPDLSELAQSGPWAIFEVADSPLVEPLENEPIVRTDIHDSEHEWTPAVAPWFQSPAQWDLHWASSGPDGWQRTDDPSTAERRTQAPVEVSNIEAGTDWLRFEVSQIGTPILVKTSFHPNWEASGADGPWRVSPNLMVVVPTDTAVELSYGRSTVEIAGWGLSWIGVVFVVLLARAAPPTMPSWPRDDGSADEDYPVDDDPGEDGRFEDEPSDPDRVGPDADGIYHPHDDVPAPEEPELVRPDP
jgi:hypothetical protein